MRCFTAAALLLALASSARVDDDGAGKTAPRQVEEDVVDKAVRLAEEAEKVKLGLTAEQAPQAAAAAAAAPQAIGLAKAFPPAGSTGLLHVSEEPAAPEHKPIAWHRRGGLHDSGSPILSRTVPDNTALVPPLPSPEPQASDAEKMAANPVTPEAVYSEEQFLADKVNQMMGTTEQPVQAESYLPIEEALVNVHMYGTKNADIPDVKVDKELIDTMAHMEAAAAAKATTTAAPATTTETATTTALTGISLAESGTDLVDQAVADAKKAEAEMDRMVMP